MMNAKTLAAGLLAVTLTTGIGSAAWAADLVTIKVGFGAGGTFDISSRMIARHLGKYLPGDPEVIVQNAPGAGSLKLVKLMLSTEPANGTVLAAVSPTVAIAPLLDPANADFDPADIVWVGSLSSAPAYCITTKASGIDTVEKFLSESFHVGATGKNTASYQQASIVKKALGAQFSIVTGFDGVPEILLAMERGELAAFCVASELDLKREGALEKFNVIGSFGSNISPEFPDVPRFSDLITDPTNKAAAQFIELTRDINFPLMAPPGTPPETVAALRKAYTATVNDPEFIAEMTTSGELELDPKTGEEITVIIEKNLAVDPAVIEAVQTLVE